MEEEKINRENKKTDVKSKKIRTQEYSLKKLEQIQKEEQVLDMLVQEIDENFNMIGVIGNNIKCIVPREEASSIVGDDGLVEEKHIVNKKGKLVHVCIKAINNTNDGIELVLSKRKLELKVRKWMYMHLKAGMKLKGTIVSLTDYAAFADVGGGVTGVLKLQDISDIGINNAGDILRIGQRIPVLVKKFDRDTGKIELSYKEFLGTFEENISKIKEGDIIEGIVRNRIKTGIFVELKPNLIGLAEHVNGVEYGQKVLVSIKRILPEKKKIKLIIIG
ncbi:MAG: S1 RNA-binding domain-containing protein [Clostridia bacterium]|nr:S1 RNA-binding domain-containing protein [Clostridia bacterium]